VAAERRTEAGLVTGGPVHIVTPLAVLRKDDDERPFAIESLTPGVSADEVVANTGFELTVDGEPPTTVEPTAEQLQLLRTEIDPAGTARFDFLSGTERIDYLERLLEQEWEQAERRLQG
jgi:hypothetical protein